MTMEYDIVYEGGTGNKVLTEGRVSVRVPNIPGDDSLVGDVKTHRIRPLNNPAARAIAMSNADAWLKRTNKKWAKSGWSVLRIVDAYNA